MTRNVLHSHTNGTDTLYAQPQAAAWSATGIVAGSDTAQDSVYLFAALTDDVEYWIRKQAGGSPAEGDVIVGSIGKEIATQSGIDTIDDIVDDIRAHTAELQANQGNWLTAVGFSTHEPSDVVFAMLSVADDFKATGYSTHNASDVVLAMQAVADDFKTDLTLALLQGELADLIAHGDVTWVGGGGGGSATEEKQDLILANLAQAIIVVRNPTYNSGLSLGPLFLGATYSVATLNPVSWTVAIDFDLTGWQSCLHIGPEKFYGTLSSTQAVVEILGWGQLCAKTHKWVLTAYKDNVHVPLGAGTVEVLELGQNS